MWLGIRNIPLCRAFLAVYSQLRCQRSDENVQLLGAKQDCCCRQEMTHAREIGVRLYVTPLCVHLLILIQKTRKKEKQQRHQPDHERFM